MGYALYEITRFDSDIIMKRGYGVECKCHKKGCKERVNRGLACLCYSCGWYFCGSHLTSAYCDKHDLPIEFECFAGEDEQICHRCEKLAYQMVKKYGCHEYLEQNNLL